jgi:carboxypeptidase family protein
MFGKVIGVVSMIAIASPSLGASYASGQSPPTAAQRKKSGIAGVVRDSLGRAIRLANILVDGESLTTVSDDSGRFDLRGLSSGPNGFTVLKVGYAPVSFETSLPPDSVLVLAIRMRSVQTLSTVKVTGERINAYLARTGFAERRRMGFGSFLSPEQVDSVADLIVTPSQFLRGMRGIDLQCGNLACVPVARNYASCLSLFVDGAPYGPARVIDSFGLNPNSIAAIEVYDRPAVVPIEFQGTLPEKRGRGLSATGGCGAIALWTKTHVPR